MALLCGWWLISQGKAEGAQWRLSSSERGLLLLPFPSPCSAFSASLTPTHAQQRQFLFELPQRLKHALEVLLPPSCPALPCPPPPPPKYHRHHNEETSTERTVWASSGTL